MESANICEICKEPISIEYTIPCGHSFCYLCIRRHLSERDFCPVCRGSPYGLHELKSKHRPKGVLPAANQLFKRSEDNLRRELGRFRLSTAGNKSMLNWRFNEFCMLLDNERLKETPGPVSAIVAAVEQNECRMVESKRRWVDDHKVLESLCRMKEIIKKRHKDHLGCQEMSPVV
jgi:hypothetical protein